MKARARSTTVNDQSAILKLKPMARPRITIRGNHLRGGAYSVCATPMAVYIRPKMLQARRISGPMLLAIMTMAGDEQYSARATYPPASSNNRRATHHNAAPSQRPKMMNGKRAIHALGTTHCSLTIVPAALRAILKGSAPTHPVNGEVMRYSCPGRGGNPEATYSSSSGDSLRLEETHAHCAKKASSISPARICGRPTLNSFSDCSM